VQRAGLSGATIEPLQIAAVCFYVAPLRLNGCPISLCVALGVTAIQIVVDLSQRDAAARAEHYVAVVVNHLHQRVSAAYRLFAGSNPPSHRAVIVSMLGQHVTEPRRLAPHPRLRDPFLPSRHHSTPQPPRCNNLPSRQLRGVGEATWHMHHTEHPPEVRVRVRRREAEELRTNADNIRAVECHRISRRWLKK
jgi:hypothetical protein